MEFLQQQPSEISLRRDSTKLILQEQTNTNWLFGMLAVWAVPGISIPLLLFTQSVPIWIITIALPVMLVGGGMTLFSWVVAQTWTLDTVTNTVTVAQKGLFGSTTCERYGLHEVSAVQLMPKTRINAWSFYIVIRLASGKNLEIDLTSSEIVDRKIVGFVREFLNSRIESSVKECVVA
jgi:hypothetical protein